MGGRRRASVVCPLGSWVITLATLWYCCQQPIPAAAAVAAAAAAAAARRFGEDRQQGLFSRKRREYIQVRPYVLVGRIFADIAERTDSLKPAKSMLPHLKTNETSNLTRSKLLAEGKYLDEAHVLPHTSPPPPPPPPPTRTLRIPYPERTKQCFELRRRHSWHLDSCVRSRERYILKTVLARHRTVMEPNMFPYDLPPGVEHWTLWSTVDLTTDEIESFVTMWLMKNLPDVREWSFDDNEERSILLFHVHVYLRRGVRRLLPNAGYMHFARESLELSSPSSQSSSPVSSPSLSPITARGDVGQGYGIRISKLYVDPIYRGRGVASSILDALHSLYPRKVLIFRPEDPEKFVSNWSSISHIFCLFANRWNRTMLAARNYSSNNKAASSSPHHHQKHQYQHHHHKQQQLRRHPASFSSSASPTMMIKVLPPPLSLPPMLSSSSKSPLSLLISQKNHSGDIGTALSPASGLTSLTINAPLPLEPLNDDEEDEDEEEEEDDNTAASSRSCYAPAAAVKRRRYTRNSATTPALRHGKRHSDRSYRPRSASGRERR